MAVIQGLGFQNFGDLIQGRIHRYDDAFRVDQELRRDLLDMVGFDYRGVEIAEGNKMVWPGQPISLDGSSPPVPVLFNPNTDDFESAGILKVLILKAVVQFH